jgi:hypothetical protein
MELGLARHGILSTIGDDEKQWRVRIVDTPQTGAAGAGTRRHANCVSGGRWTPPSPLLSSLSVPLFFRPLMDYACMDQAYNKQFLYLHQGKQLMEKVAGVAFFFETTGVGLGVLSAGAGTC